MDTKAKLKGHVVELLIDRDHVDVKPVGKYLAIRTTAQRAQEIYDALKGLAPTIQPFETLDG